MEVKIFTRKKFVISNLCWILHLEINYQLKKAKMKEQTLKTQLPQAINTIDEAKAFLNELFKNGETYHPDDDASDCLEGIVTKEQGAQLNKLMDDIRALPGNEYPQNMAFDPCDYLLDLDPEYLPPVVELLKEEA